MLAPLRDLRKISLALTPQQVAEQLGHVEDLCFIDSSGNLPKNYHRTISLVAAQADRILTGNIAEASELKKVLAQAEGSASALPHGGALGWIDYDGAFTFGIYSSLLVFDHATQQWWSNGNLEEQLQPAEAQAAPTLSPFLSNFSEEVYLSKVEKIQEYIAAGDIYQVNLTQRFEAEISGSHLFPLYKALRASSPAPMAGYMRLNGREILSSSPETFLKIDGHTVETRPIKGTRPRYALSLIHI